MKWLDVLFFVDGFVWCYVLCVGYEFVVLMDWLVD